MAEEYNRDNINPTHVATFTGDEGILRDISQFLAKKNPDKNILTKTNCRHAQPGIVW